MKDSRSGECLWFEWSGDGLSVARLSSTVFMTYEHVELDNEVVSRALASALQRDGTVTSLGEGYRAVEGADIIYGYIGHLDGEIFPSVCNEVGITEHEDTLEDIRPVTWVVLND